VDLDAEVDATPTSDSDAFQAFDGDRVAQLQEAGVDTLVIGAPDVNGEFRAKRFALELFSSDDVEIAFSDYLLGTDVLDEVMEPRPGYQGYFPTAATGMPDIFVRPDWSQLRRLPWDPATALVLGDFYGQDSTPVEVAPRQVLARVLSRLRMLGFEAMAGTEFEFLVFKGKLEDNRRDPGGLTPLSVGPAYSYTRAAADEVVMGSVRRMIDAAGIPVETGMTEAAPGQSEITIRYSEAMRAADNAFLYKHFLRELLDREGFTASFIAKPSVDAYGNSGHVHISLRGLDGKPAMLGEDGDLSAVTDAAIGGFLHSMRAFAPFYAPTVNSYHRYQSEYSFAGDTVAWGFDNRTCGLRVIRAGESGTRLESRVPGSDMNPYIALAATLAAIGSGIEKGMSRPAPVEADAYADRSIERAPRDLASAIGLLEDDEVAFDWLGEDFVRFYVETRAWEVEQHRTAVTEWELRRYL
jgi:glutamine synthetase